MKSIGVVIFGICAALLMIVNAEAVLVPVNTSPVGVDGWTEGQASLWYNGTPGGTVLNSTDAIVGSQSIAISGLAGIDGIVETDMVFDGPILQSDKVVFWAKIDASTAFTGWHGGSIWIMTYEGGRRYKDGVLGTVGTNWTQYVLNLSDFVLYGTDDLDWGVISDASVRFAVAEANRNYTLQIDGLYFAMDVAPPTADAGPDIITVAENISIVGSGTGTGTLSYVWTSPTIGTVAGQTLNISAQTVLGMDEDITLTVTDVYGLTATDTMHVQDIYNAVFNVAADALETLIGDLPSGLTKIDRDGDGNTTTVK